MKAPWEQINKKPLVEEYKKNTIFFYLLKNSFKTQEKRWRGLLMMKWNSRSDFSEILVRAKGS